MWYVNRIVEETALGKPCSKASEGGDFESLGERKDFINVEVKSRAEKTMLPFWKGEVPLLIESRTIGSDLVSIYRTSKYRVMTIIPVTVEPILNVYLFTQEELNTFLQGYDRNAEFIVSMEQVGAMA